MNENDIIVPRQDDGEYSVSLPVSQEGFSEFIKELIGSKKKISSEYDNLLVTPDFLRSIDAALCERIMSQNTAEIVDCTIEVQFTDGRTYTMDSVADAVEISPLSDARTRFLSFEQIWLIQFPGQIAPLRQTVKMEISSETFSGIRSGAKRKPVVVTVEYHRRSWAEDITNLCEKIVQAHPAVEKTRRWRKRSRDFLISEGAITAYSLVLILVYCYAAILFSAKPVPPAADQTGSVSIRDVYELIASSRPPASLVGSAASVVAFIGGGVALVTTLVMFLQNLMPNPPKVEVRFLMFPNDVLNQDLEEQYKRRSFWRSISAFGLSVLASVVAAYLYELYFLS